jgi:hypothetical protein
VVAIAGLAQTRARLHVGEGLEESIPVLRDEPEQHPVHQPQQRPVEVVQAQLVVSKLLP